MDVMRAAEEKGKGEGGGKWGVGGAGAILFYLL